MSHSIESPDYVDADRPVPVSHISRIGDGWTKDVVHWARHKLGHSEGSANIAIFGLPVGICQPPRDMLFRDSLS